MGRTEGEGGYKGGEVGRTEEGGRSGKGGWRREGEVKGEGEGRDK